MAITLKQRGSEMSERATLKKVERIIYSAQVKELWQFIAFIEGKMTKPEALSVMEKNERMIKFYYPNWNYSEEDLDFAKDYVKTGLKSAYLSLSALDPKRAGAWFDLIDRHKETASGPCVCLNVVEAEAEVT
jgi:hypothetical protein